MEKPNKKEYPVERIIGHGFSEEDFEVAKKSLKEVFEGQNFDDLKSIEREKTKEEEELIWWLNEVTNEVVQRYGVRPIDVPSKNVHIIQDKHWDRHFLEFFGDTAAFYDSIDFSIVCHDQEKSFAVFAQHILHEMLHLKSYQAVQYKEEGKQSFESYRVGLTLTSEKRGSGRLFRHIDEAVIEMLVIEIWFTKFLKDNRFHKDIQALNRAKEFIRGVGKKEFLRWAGAKEDSLEDILNDLIQVNADKESDRRYQFFSYDTERFALGILIQKLYDNNKEKFGRPDEIFDMFARGVMKGHMIELARLIDKTFGKGTFKKLGEISTEDNDPEELLKYVKSLKQ